MTVKTKQSIQHAMIVERCLHKMKIRATIDLDQVDLDEYGSMEHGVFGCDEEGVYHMYYHNRSDLVKFEDVEVLDKKNEEEY